MTELDKSPRRHRGAVRSALGRVTGANPSLSTFVRTAIRRPGVVGAIVPSSAVLADRLAEVVPCNDASTVVELGPGTGSVTEAIARRLPEDGVQLAVEVDGDMVEHLRRELPWLNVLHGDASSLRLLLAAEGVGSVQAVISGLPWALFPAERQAAMLEEVVESLAPNGVFTTFAYLHALPAARAKRFRATLEGLFEEVLVTSAVWRNVPPAITYVCRRPVRHGRTE